MDASLTSYPQLLISTFGVLISLWLGSILARGWRHRRFFIQSQKQGVPMPKHNMLFGHLLALKPFADKLPSDAHPFLTIGQLSRDYPDGMVYLDMWPFSDAPLLICTSATAATETAQKTAISLKKPAPLERWFYPISGGPNLFTMHENEWRTWRTIFNPGFSQSHIFKLVPDVVQEVKAYRDLLYDFAQKNEMFLLDDETLWFTLDMIGHTVLGKSLDSKRTKNPLAIALLSQLRWKISNQEVNLFKLWNPIRPVVAWYNSWEMNAYIGKELDKRYDEYLTALSTGKEVAGKSIISLVFDGYLKQSGSKQPSSSLDKKLRSYASYQIRTFLFAGHDTTSSSICHIFYLLSKNPSTLQKLRDEHDAVLGTSIEDAPQVISDNPHLLNQLTYTLAVIKEAMRLFPPASGIRQGLEGVDVHDDSGRPYPTGGTFVWILHQAMQRDPKYWPNPNEFIPDRWLVGPADPLYPVKGTWRPFEHGPRNCIGMGLVLMELKIVLAMTAREFDVRDAYEEFDTLRGKKGPQIKDVEGERAYQIEQGGAHPADRFPCRVSLRA